MENIHTTFIFLSQAGAIPLCVTNVSELGSWWESSNPVYGRSKNPYDILRTPGGSSGGEAALQAAAGIPLSIGSQWKLFISPQNSS